MITPFKKDGSIDYETAEKYVEWYYENGLDGIFAVCQSSEIFFLSLEERVKLNRRVYEKAKSLDKNFVVVSSGHVSDTIEGQARELNAIWESGTDALILITNRLDPNNEGDDVFIENAEKLISTLPKEAKFGFYECPYPYKRLVSEKILKWAAKTGRFYYMKDTCCDASEIKNRIEWVKDSPLLLLNANSQTLLESMRDGAQGYCGVMCNYHPKLYSWLKQNYLTQPETAQYVQSVLCMSAFIEGGAAYPLSAKYHMNLCGIPTEITSRARNSEDLTEYGKSCVRQMKLMCDKLEKELGI
jgi:4-hydroxy-tetrahydrodipicolinate synthase